MVAYAIAVCSISPSSFSQCDALEYTILQLHIGEHVEVHATSQGWCYGCTESDLFHYGIFPQACIVPICKPSSTCTEEVHALVAEMTEVLDEWWISIKDIYGKQARMDSQDEILSYIEDLMTMRKKFLSGNVPVEELREMRLELSKKIDLGNHWLGLDMIIRNEIGEPIDIDGISVIRAYREHKTAASRIARDSKPSDASVVNAFSLLVHAQSATLDCRCECEFSISLYDVTDQRFISETFVFDWSHGSLTNRNSKALFNDLGASEYPSSSPLKRDHHIVMCIRVARVAPIDAPSATVRKQSDLGPPQTWSRQPYAAAVLDLTSCIRNSPGPQEFIVHLNREDSLEQILAKFNPSRPSIQPKLVIGDANSSCTGYDKAQLMLTIEVLLGTLDQVKKSHPHIFSVNPPVELRKMYFADIISADEIRNDLYVTLLQGDLHGGKGSEKNIEARVSVINSSGIVKDSVEVITAEGPSRKSCYKSLVFYHDDKPRWNESIKIRIPEDTDQDMHLRITFHLKRSCGDKTKPEKGPFAIAFARIMEGATLIKDGTHELLVYRIESCKFDEKDTTYSRLPATRSELKTSQSHVRPQITAFVCGEKNYLNIDTLTCTTTLTHNKNMLDILRWKSNRSNLKECLERIARPEGFMLGEELVKFIPNFCDALFEIIDHHPDYSDLVFDALVSVIQLVSEERYKNFRPVLQKYIKNFHSTVAYAKLIPILIKRVRDASQTHERSLETMKALGILMQMIVKSKQCSDMLNLTSNNFGLSIDELLEEFIQFMQNKEVRMTCQSAALKYLPSIIPHLVTPGIYDPHKVTSFLVRLMGNLGDSISARYRLNFIKDIVQLEHFLSGEHRYRLLPKILENVLAELEEIDYEKMEASHLDRSEVEACGEILSDILESLYPSAGAESDYGTESELQLIIMHCFRTVLQTTISLMTHKLHADVFCAFLIAILNKMSAQTFKIYLEDQPTQIDKHDLLMEMVHLFRDLVDKSPFPPSWFGMICLQNKMILKTLKFVKSTIVEYFGGDEFDAELWNEYMLTLVAFIVQKALQPGLLSVNTKRSRLLAAQSDLRRIAADYLRSMWFQLSMEDRNKFIPSILGSFLQAALIDDGVVRDKIIPVLFDMMQCEFHSSPEKNFCRFANEMIVQLDCLVDEDRGGQQFKDQLQRITMELCRSDPELKTEGCRFICKIDTLLRHLFEYREVRTSGFCIENGMSRTVELLRYYDKIGQTDLYINYVYKLYDLHILSNNKAEAAFTLRKHAELLSWEDSQLPRALLDAHLNRHCATQRQLKIALLNEMANLFDEKELWEESVAILKELIAEYERNYEYEKLPSLLKRMADLYHKISTQGRVECTYYLVGFYGSGFPAYLNGQQFVYRGNECEAIASFQHRMLSTFTDSTLVTTMDDCSHLAKAEGKHLQIFPVKPHAEGRLDKKAVNSFVRWYYKNNEVKKFEYWKGEFRRGTKWTELDDSEIMRSWIIRRFVVAKEPLPNILKWSQIVSHSEPIECSPLVEAVATMQKNNAEMEEMAHVVLSTPLESVVPLGGKIRGVVQAFVQGGTRNYDVFFSKKCEEVLTAEERELVLQLKQLMRKQIPILEFCLYVHATRKHQIIPQFHESLVNSFLEYKRKMEEKFGKIPSQLSPGCSIYITENPKDLKGNDDRRTGAMESSNSASVMSIAGVFRKGGLNSTRSGRLTPRKSLAQRHEIKNSFEYSTPKRISSSSDRSLESLTNIDGSLSITPRSTVDISHLEESLISPASHSSFSFKANDRLRSSASSRKSIESSQIPPPLPPRRPPPNVNFRRLTSSSIDESQHDQTTTSSPALAAV